MWSRCLGSLCSLCPSPETFLILGHQAPAPLRAFTWGCFPRNALVRNLWCGSWGCGSAQHLLLRLCCISYWEQRPEASWAKVRRWFLPCHGVETNKEQSSKSRLSSTLKDFVRASAHADLALLFTVLGARPPSVQLPVPAPGRNWNPLLDEHCMFCLDLRTTGTLEEFIHPPIYWIACSNS